jgi:hypothetical protein
MLALTCGMEGANETFTIPVGADVSRRTGPFVGPRAANVQPLVVPPTGSHIDVSNVQVIGSHASVPPPSPRLSQSKPWKSSVSHCSPGAIMPSPQSESGPVELLVSLVAGSMVGSAVVVVGSPVVELLELLELDDSVASVVEDEELVVSGSPELDEELASDDELGSVVVDGEVEMLVTGSSVVSLDDAPVSLDPPDAPGSPPFPHASATTPTPNQIQRIIAPA